MNDLRGGGPVERVDVSAYRIPTDRPESDGTFTWDHTICVVAEVTGGGRRGLGYTYAPAAVGRLIRDTLAPAVEGVDAFAVSAAHDRMVRAVRNAGAPGIASCAIAAVDTALWDLKARLLDLPLVRLLGPVRDAIPVYGSGGFTSYAIAELKEQLAGWRDDGIGMVKMKVGREPAEDARRVEAAREAVGPGVGLFVDANGAYARKQALALAEAFARLDVRWFEEPVSSDDLEGLRLLRDRGPAGMDIAAGEYGYDLVYFRRMLDASAVDVLQADATRCRGITGFVRAAALCGARAIPLSSHTAPSIHVHACCALTPARHLEYFHDHVRVEALLFDGAPRPRAGALAPDLSRPGLGLELKRADAARFAVAGV
ncbi:mandelate racemase [Sorangium cellulosum]|uniref:Mandelate racemase n=1 Tax=Sorangium cellulosum TaxID=56 RepID=A0A4P2Q3B1_SORCE|nr:enolase C-terminal domain-like protein [Sorangium cellulosum]AUX23800.1 mandelate racemase [Sorangium cellulosum]